MKFHLIQIPSGNYGEHVESPQGASLLEQSVLYMDFVQIFVHHSVLVPCFYHLAKINLLVHLDFEFRI